jgi:multicomponent Na+:H+ antiporter subunit E
MKLFLSNILLSFVWVALTGDFYYGNFLIGFIFSFFFLWISTGFNKNETKYFSRVPRAISFFFYFTKEMIKANLFITYDILTIKQHMKPGIVAVPLTASTDLEITLFANLITLTPGTFTIDISDDKKIIYVHSIYLYNKEKFVRELKKGLERRLLEVLR